MPYPETCPECGGAFRNTGSHFTARRNEVGRHVLLELGCQATSRRFWWDFTTGDMTAEGRAARGTARDTLVSVAAVNGTHADSSPGTPPSASSNGHGLVSTVERAPEPVLEPEAIRTA